MESEASIPSSAVKATRKFTVPPRRLNEALRNANHRPLSFSSPQLNAIRPWNSQDDVEKDSPPSRSSSQPNHTSLSNSPGVGATGIMHGIPPLRSYHPESKNDVPPFDPKETVRRGILNGITKAQSSGYCSGLSKAVMDNITEILLHHITVEEAAAARGFYTLHESNPELHARLKAISPDITAQSRLGDHLEEATSDVGMDELSHEPSLDVAIDELISEATSHGAIEEHIRITETKSYSTTIIINIVYQTSVNRIERMGSQRLGEAIAVSLAEFSSPNDRFKGPVRLSAAKLLENGNVEVAAHAEHREDLERLIRISGWHEEFERSLGPLPVQTYNVAMHNMRIGCMTFVESKEKSAIINALTDENFPVDSDNSIRSVIGNIDWCLGKAAKKGKQRKREPRTAALMVKFLLPEQANKALANGLYWQGTYHACSIADGHFVLRRCMNCQHYGHFTDDCSAEPQCGFCAEQHQTNKCPSNPDRHSAQPGARGEINNIKCVLCGGPHVAAGPGCLVKKQTKYCHRFPTATLPLAAEPIAQVLDAIKIEPSQHGIISGRSQDDHSIPETLPRRTDSFRILGLARNAGLRQNASLRHKREAEDGLPMTASGREVKRVKQEYLEDEDLSYREHSRVLYQQPLPYEDALPETASDGDHDFIKKEEHSPQEGPVYREDSMAPYRQPSPYILHRSE